MFEALYFKMNLWKNASYHRLMVIKMKRLT